MTGQATGLINVAGPNSVQIDTSKLPLPQATPTARDSYVSMFSRQTAAKFSAPAWIDPLGKIREAQAAIGSKTIGYVVAPNIGGTTAQTVGFAMGTLSTAGSGATGDANTRIGAARRIKYLTTAVAGQTAGWVPNSGAYLLRGNAAGVGGYYVRLIGGVVTRSTNSRGFFGVATGGNTYVTATAFTTQTHLFGVGWEAGDTNLQLIGNDGSGNVVKVDLGIPVADGMLLDVQIAIAPNSSTQYAYVTNIVTGTTGSGSITTDIPSQGTSVAPHMEISNGTDAVAVQIDCMSMYFENDI